ncbi:MAG: F0F1 ATP synthase subunit A, partial [Chloroflexota bacterium]|nr:F0F1 ATP synthase subunit A [Chloroflexota bacterium]
MLATILLALTILIAPPQGEPTIPPPTVPAHATAETPPAGDDIMHHVLDERKLKVPFAGYVYLPPAGSWMLGPLDITPTKYVVYLWITGLLMLLIFIPAGRAARRCHATGDCPRGGHNVIEAMVLFFRDQIVMPNIGHGGERYVPFVTTLFFFIVIANLLGLVPYGGSPTANISVTAALALLSLVVVEIAGMKALGPSGYMATIVYWNKDLPLGLRIPMALILTPVELLGKFSKPFALAIRLMANMTAGKIVIYSLIGLLFVFGSWWVVVGPIAMTVALMFLKIFVAFLQAYIFALLT